MHTPDDEKRREEKPHFIEDLQEVPQALKKI
jgi:hypothetical protein